MEFKYRAMDKRPHPPPPPPRRYRVPAMSSSSSGYSFFTQQDIKAGYGNPVFGRPNGYVSTGYGHVNEYYRCTNDECEKFQREIEKEGIRGEFIAKEIFRMQMLEAEVRRQMNTEKELTFQARGIGEGAFEGFPFQLGGGMGLDPREGPFQQAMGRSLEERIAMSLEHKLGIQGTRGVGRFEMVPFQRKD